MMLKRLSIALSCAVLIACDPSPDELLVTDAYGYVPIGDSGMTVAYFTVHNNTRHDVHLESVHSSLFERAEIHETVLQDERALMRALPNVGVAPGEQFQFKPGAAHLMLMQPRKTIAAGTVDTLTFNFSDHHAVVARVEFFDRNAPPTRHEESH